LFSLVAFEDDTPEVKVYSDRVYVSDHLFISTGNSSDILPDGYTSIGTVETLLAITEPVKTITLQTVWKLEVSYIYLLVLILMI